MTRITVCECGDRYACMWGGELGHRVLLGSFASLDSRRKTSWFDITRMGVYVCVGVPAVNEESGMCVCVG